MTSSPVIGIFDSGVGGLSILKEVIELKSPMSIKYIADKKYFPYGEKSQKTIKSRADKLTKFLINRGCTHIVIACNSATSAASDYLRKKYSIQFVGVEPAVKPAVKLTKVKNISVLATKLTFQSKKYQTLIDSFARNILIKQIVAPKLIVLVEKGENNSPTAEIAIKKLISNYKIDESDVIVFGSTHYPFLTNKFKAVLHPNTIFLNPAQQVATRLKRITKTKFSKNKTDVNIDFFTTGNRNQFENVAYKLLERKVKAKKVVL